MSASSQILYVEDNQDSCEMVGLMLSHADDNYSITSVSTADKALALIESQPFDLYILDYALPEITGVELCRKIRESNKKVPILFFTAMARDTDREQAISAGADEFLIKPNDLDNLPKTVKRFLNKSMNIFNRKPITRRRCSGIF
jgi:CheY-like chemotaxis protein